MRILRSLCYNGLFYLSMRLQFLSPFLVSRKAFRIMLETTMLKTPIVSEQNSPSQTAYVAPTVVPTVVLSARRRPRHRLFRAQSAVVAKRVSRTSWRSRLCAAGGCAALCRSAAPSHRDARPIDALIAAHIELGTHRKALEYPLVQFQRENAIHRAATPTLAGNDNDNDAAPLARAAR